MSIEGPEELGSVNRGPRSSDHDGIGTSFEVQQSRDAGTYKHDALKPQREGHWWSGYAGILLMGFGVLATAVMLKRERDGK